MTLSNKNILLISPEPWNHVFVSKHHYAVNLSKKGNKVFFLNPPSSSKYKITNSRYEDLFIINYSGFVKGLRFLPTWLQRYFISIKFNNLQKLCGVNFDIVWSFDNSVFFDFYALPEKVLCISHIVDLNQDFNTRQAATTAKVCFGVIPDIVERLFMYNTNTYLITHGVNLSEYSSNIVTLPGTNGIKALYVGNLAMPFIDWDLLQQAVISQPKTDFIFLGSNMDFVPEPFKSYENTYILEAVPPAELWSYLNAADILMLAYSEEYYVTYASPHKFWQYLAVGKPIITSYTKEYLPFEDLIYMARTSESWCQLIGEVIENLTNHNTEDLILARKSLAADNSYERKIQEVEKCLTEIL
ncbi:glycosyltransferase family protein [Fulvivirga sediminis]|uniref:Glycosyltransferase family 1 protein n=1 Tax=Fulvivirga sediminis TaxID=2803949 RepID=A0A937JXU2_9BACT|nr:hypothetical protein [Fulvivirga sediminis]MBL3654984.1 hypothetical protein [Fulvivirga sediminis]